MCITPLTLKRDYNTMAGERTKIVPCGKCIKCLQRRQNGWAFRLTKESQISTSACFITLTYSDYPTSPQGLPTLHKKDYQNFLKRLRKKLPKTSGIKYYACGEYGTQTHRPHYHAIMFNLPQRYIQDRTILANIWGHGHVDIAPCNTATIMYVTKYLLKGGFTPHPDIIDYTTGEIIQDDRTKEFSLMSKKMGSNYLTPQMIKYHKETLNSYITLKGGQPAALPRYFRDQIYTKEESKIINEAALLARETDFIKLFDDCFKKQITWKKNLIRKDEKQQRLERQLL